MNKINDALLRPAKTPWGIRNLNIEKVGFELYSANGESVAVVTFLSDAQRIVSCVNACESLNPDYLPDFYRTARKIIMGSYTEKDLSEASRLIAKLEGRP